MAPLLNLIYDDQLMTCLYAGDSDVLSLYFSNIWWQMPLFLIYYFHRLILTRVHFTYSNFAWGLHGGVDVMWCGGLFVLDLH
jgi:hypothetical protein